MISKRGVPEPYSPARPHRILRKTRRDSPPDANLAIKVPPESPLCPIELPRMPRDRFHRQNTGKARETPALILKITRNWLDVGFLTSLQGAMSLSNSSASSSSVAILPVSSLTVGTLPGTTSRSNRAEKIPHKKIIREIGLKVTSQRLQILEVVRNGASHFTAQEVYEAVSERSSPIGFATVYRFLRTLSEHSYVIEVRMGGMPARYEWAGKRHHDHLTCTECAKIVEFENTEIERLQDKVAKHHGFTLSDHVLELFGVCNNCRKNQAGSHSTP